MNENFVPGAIIDITYEDSDGRLTSRKVRVLTTYQSSCANQYLKAWCFKRNAERTFRLDRILQVDPVAGPAPLAGLPIIEQPAAMPGASPPPPGDAPAARAPLHMGRKKAPASSGFGHTFLYVLGVALFITFIKYQDLTNLIWNPPRPAAAQVAGTYLPKADSPVPSPRAVSWTTSLPVNKQPVYDTLVKTEVYRGQTIKSMKAANGVSYYLVDGLAPIYSYRETVVYINTNVFIRATSIRNEKLISLYASADTNLDAMLSWDEITAFQKSLFRTHVYKNNNIALRPDEFLAQGGGDCDDWALVTCGLLRFWGWESYIGCLSGPANGENHALCLVWSKTRPAHGQYFEYPKGLVTATAIVKPGYYIPVDYDCVGSFSNAVGEGWALTRIYDPESIYGIRM
jgi:hypothetical protein